MERRSFVGLIGGMGMFAGAGFSGPAGGRRTRFYSLEFFNLKNGVQSGRMQEHFAKALLPALSTIHSGPKIALEALVAPHTPQVALILGFQSLEDMWSVHTRLGAYAEPPYETQTSRLIEAPDHSPEIRMDGQAGRSGCIFELRVYHSPAWTQLRALHERFAAPDIKIFHRAGIRPILYGSTLIGENMPNMTYLTPFDNLAAREKAWNAFAADPEWIKVRRESAEKYGQISSVIQISLYRAADYSRLQ